MAEKLIIIGGTAAGLSAASKAKRNDPTLEITVFEKSGYVSYGSCGLPYFIGGLIESPDDLVSLHVDEIREKRGIHVFIHHEVILLDSIKKTVTAKNLDDGSEAVYPYDKLVIATGASPIRPDIPGIDAGGVFFLRNVEDGIRLKVASVSDLTCCIIGGGFIGLEVAEELTNAGLNIHIFEALPRLLPFLPETFSRIVLETLEKNSVTVHLGVKVEAIKEEEGKVKGLVSSAGTVSCDMIVISIGVVPNNALAKMAGLKLGIKGAISVDDSMQTSDPAIWACGDCAEAKNSITGKPCYIPLGTTANKMGRVAGSSVSGEKSTFHGVQGSMVTKVFDCYIASTGLSLAQAREAGFNASECSIQHKDKASYYPNHRIMNLNFVFDTVSGRILGAQGLGSESAAIRINTLVAAIDRGMTVSEINDLDLIYAPPVAPVYDPILIAASQAMKKVKK